MRLVLIILNSVMLSCALMFNAYASDIKNPGILVHAADDEATTLDPAQVEAGEGGETIILQVYERLLEFGPGGPELLASLASKVPSVANGLISNSGLTYTFPIRKGVKFHDGTDLTAEDVKFSWDRVITMDLPESAADALIDIVISTEVVDDYSFRVNLKEPSASFLNGTVVAMVASIVSKDAVMGNGGVTAGKPNPFMAQNVVGTGAYTLKAWNRSENILLDINNNYWGEKAKLNVRVEIGAEPDVRVLGLRAGNYDTIETDPSFVADIRGADGVTLYTGGLLLEPIHIGFNLNIPDGALPPEDTVPEDFFHDPRIRQAFNHGFDYNAFLNGPLAGFGDFNPHYIPIGIFGHDKAAPVYAKQDKAKAEALFRETGYWDKGFSVSVITEESNLFADAALVLKDSLERLNPKFRINVLAVAEAVFDDAHAENPLRYAMWVKNADPFADPHPYLSAYAHPDGEWGEVHGFANGYKNPAKIAGLIDRASVELDTGKRAAMYSELQYLLYDDPMWLIPAQEGVTMAHRSWIKGFAMNPLWPRPSLKFSVMDK
jgi:peptide/nickel transport system substrate-binding protein